MSTATLTEAVVETTEPTTNYTEQDISVYFSRYAEYKAIQKQANDARRLAASLLDCFVLLGLGRYARMTSPALYRELVALGVNITVKEDQFSIYHTAGIAMAALSKGETEASKVWDAVNKAWKTKGHGIEKTKEAIEALSKSNASWADFVTRINAECDALKDVIAPALDKLESTVNADWDAGHYARFILLGQRLGYTVTK